MSSPNILLLSAYDAVSHQHWRKGLVAAFPEYNWTVLTLPPRHFAWRIRGNSLSWASMRRETLDKGYDLIIATSMTDLSALKGMVPSLANTPTLLYFHENQFDYPTTDKAFESVEAKITSLYAALAATRIAFNSEHNRQSFLNGVQALLKKMPDHTPSNIRELLNQRSVTLPVPIDSSWYGIGTDKSDTFTLLWNHRWEYDKAPERLFAALTQLQKRGVDFRIHMLGQRFRKTPAVFDQMRETLSAHIGEWGYIEEMARYQKIVGESHVVISTALHDFQGLSILEATAAGVVPCVPDRLAYPEFIPESFRYSSCPSDEAQEADALTSRLLTIAEAFENNALPSPPDITPLNWELMRSRYQDEINALL